MDDVDDLFPKRPRPGTDPTLSADGLDGLFDDKPDSSLAVDTVAELFESPAAPSPQPEPPADNATPAATLEVNEDILDEVERLFEPMETLEQVDTTSLSKPSAVSDDAPLRVAATASDATKTPSELEPVGTAPASEPINPDAPIGELVASLADELHRLEVALRSSEDDSDK